MPRAVVPRDFRVSRRRQNDLRRYSARKEDVLKGERSRVVNPGILMF